MCRIVISRINIDGIRFNSIVRHFSYSVFGGQETFLNHYLIFCTVINSRFAGKVINPLIPASELTEPAYSRISVVGCAVSLHIVRWCCIQDFPWNHVFLCLSIPVCIGSLVSVFLLTDIHVTKGRHLPCRISILHSVRCNVQWIFRGNTAGPGILFLKACRIFHRGIYQSAIVIGNIIIFP